MSDLIHIKTAEENEEMIDFDNCIFYDSERYNILIGH